MLFHIATRLENQAPSKSLALPGKLDGRDRPPSTTYTRFLACSARNTSPLHLNATAHASLKLGKCLASRYRRIRVLQPPCCTQRQQIRSNRPGLVTKSEAISSAGLTCWSSSLVDQTLKQNSCSSLLSPFQPLSSFGAHVHFMKLPRRWSYSVRTPPLLSDLLKRALLWSA